MLLRSIKKVKAEAQQAQPEASQMLYQSFTNHLTDYSTLSQALYADVFGYATLIAIGRRILNLKRTFYKTETLNYEIKCYTVLIHEVIVITLSETSQFPL